MDNIDYKILKCLKENARLTASAISEEINLSVSAVIERIKKMETGGIIRGYTIEVDQKKLGNEMVAIMEVRLKHPKYYEEFVGLIKQNDSIVACFYMTGDFDFILKIVTDSAAGLDEVYKFVKGYEGVSATETHFVLKTEKDEVSVIPEGDRS
ncbi:MAG: Lrp/AsnC family transcriptional regulator [Coprococcus sp.]|nr:Lrp/AsnC family transcriptional regulator [Coprococcus sp.]